MARKPDWLRIKKTCIYDSTIATANLIRNHNLNTVCENAQCPNKGECYGNRTATFLVLGNICSRSCTFCAVKKDRSLLQIPDPSEPFHVAEAAKELQLDYIVITMVTRDDLEDGGTDHIVKVVEAIRKQYRPDIDIELLVSDLQGDFHCIEKILDRRPAVFNHNVETIPSLYPQVRPQADYQRSLQILRHAGKYAPDIPRKSGFMLGLGEKEDDVISLMTDLNKAGVNILTIGQYLAPSSLHHPVRDFIRPEAFQKYRDIAIDIGFKACFSGPFVRSSYKAKEALMFYKQHLYSNDAMSINSNL